MTHLELFRCEPLRARLTAKACAQNYLDAQHRRAVRTADQRLVSSRAIGLGPCRDCAIGRAHAAGETPDVIMTPVAAPAANETQKEPPMPQTFEERKRLVVEAALRKDRPILEVAREFGVSRTAVRYWIEEVGHDPKTWPKMRPGPGARRAPAPPKVQHGEELEELNRALERPKGKKLEPEERAAKAPETDERFARADPALDEARKVSDAILGLFLGSSTTAPPLVVELDRVPYRLVLAIQHLAQGKLDEAKRHIAAFEVCR